MNDNSFLNPIYSAIENMINDLSNPIAVFDADGTLWNNDVGLEFFRYQIKNKLIVDDGLLQNFSKSYKRNAPLMCESIVRKNKGVSLKQYRTWCRNFLEENSLHLFSFQKQLLHFLKERQVTLWVVSASSEWLVEEAIQCYQLPIDHVIGVKSRLKNEIITDQIRYPLSIDKGKAELFLKQSRNMFPFFVSGNTLSDLELLRIATHFRFVIAFAKQGERQYAREQALLEIAKTNSWFYKTLE